MNKIIGTISCLIFVLVFGTAQGLELLHAEKFQFNNLRYEYNSEFAGPLVMCNHSGDLSYYGSDFDAMGVSVGSILSYDEGEFFHVGSFVGESDITLLDINYNNESDQLAFLLDLSGPCVFESPSEQPEEFVFPIAEDMTGIVHFTDKNGVDSYWTTHIIAEDVKSQQMWSVGELSILTGHFKDTLTYVDKTGSEIELVGNSSFNNLYVIALDSEGMYKWSKSFDGPEGYGVGYMTSVVKLGDEILFSHYNFFDTKFEYLDFNGQVTREAVRLHSIRVDCIERDETDNMVVGGSYTYRFPFPNVSLNGEEYILDDTEQYDGFLIQYNPEFEINWVQYIKGAESEVIYDFDLVDGEIYLTGAFLENAIFDFEGQNEEELNAIGNADLYVAKYSKNGDYRWVQQIGDQLHEAGYNINVENSNILLFGQFTDRVDLDPDPDAETLLESDDPTIYINGFHAEFYEHPVLSTKDNVLQSRLSPNPVSSILQTEDSNDKILSITGLTGEVVGTYNSSTIDVSDLPNGLYVVSILINGTVSNQMISVVH